MIYPLGYYFVIYHIPDHGWQMRQMGFTGKNKEYAERWIEHNRRRWGFDQAVVVHSDEIIEKLLLLNQSLVNSS